MIKQQAVAFLRRTFLLSGTERLRFYMKLAKRYRTNRAVVSSYPDFPFPPVDVVYDAHGDVDFQNYLQSGRYVAAFVLETCRKHIDGELNRICEWGCGPGRIIRHMPSLDMANPVEAYGTDYNGKSIAWASENIPHVSFALNGLTPPLSFDDDQFDCLYSTSVFTHLSEEMHHAWLAENLRVVRPGGVVLLTIHGDAFADKLLPRERATYDSGKLVVRSNVREGSRLYVAFQSPRYVREELLRGLEILDHETSPDRKVMGGQDVWVVRSP